MNRKTAGAILALFATAMFLTVISSTRHKADMLLVNGTVLTLDAQNTVAGAVAIRGNRIAAVGTSADLRSRFDSDTVIDLEGKTVVPGFIDAHAHISGLGQLMQSVILVGTSSPEEIVGLVRARTREVAPGAWIHGRGWDQNRWENKEFPSASQLDAVSPDHPVVLIRIDGHAIWVNTRALELAQVSRSTQDPPGGRIIRTRSGEPTGVFLDEARALIERFVPSETPEEIERDILTAAAACAKSGLTEVHDMGIDSLRIGIYRRLAGEKRLPVRIYAAISAPGPAWNFWKEQGPLIGAGGGMLTIRSMKLYMDGALGSRGAALVEQYSDDPGNRGLTMLGAAELESLVRDAIAHGFQPCVHAIGDRANHAVLDAYEHVLNALPAGDYRPRIEHAQVILPEDISRFKRLGVLPSMQPIHATSDMYWAEARLGPSRIHEAYAWRSLLETGSIIPGGSDFPNDGMEPLWGFYAAFTRADRSGYPQDGWYRDQRMTREEAIRCFTAWGAYAGFEEGAKGSIEPGKLADLTLLSRNIMQVSPPEVLTTNVEMTIVDGRVTYRKPAGGGAP
ncbi:MAG TPA: amidohydrolase [Bacteroidota bacterium]|jgi:predicted amidohydrolase YtcJ